MKRHLVYMYMHKAPVSFVRYSVYHYYVVRYSVYQYYVVSCVCVYYHSNQVSISVK